MFDIDVEEIEWGGKKLRLETGRLARQADGAVLATYGETTVLATAVAERSAKPGVDFFPLTVNADWLGGWEENPVPALLLLLFLSVGVPFFVVSTSAPLLQKWFAGTDHPAPMFARSKTVSQVCCTPAPGT